MVVTLVLVVESLTTLAVVVRVVVVVTVVVRVTVVTLRELVLQRGGGVEKGLVGPVLADGRGGKTKEREDLLPAECQLSVQLRFPGAASAALNNSEEAVTYLRAPERTASPSSSTHTLMMSSVWRTLRTQPTTLSDSSNWSPIRENSRLSYSAGVIGCSSLMVNLPPLSVSWRL